MREIKFRGKSISNDFSKGNWVYGTFYKSFDKYYMVEEITGSCIQIDPETIGEYVGLHDKNFGEIYEGDILKEDNGNIFIVEWYKTGLQMRALKTNDIFFTLLESCSIGILEIIGNIYENPELLK